MFDQILLPLNSNPRLPAVDLLLHSYQRPLYPSLHRHHLSELLKILRRLREFAAAAFETLKRCYLSSFFLLANPLHSADKIKFVPILFETIIALPAFPVPLGLIFLLLRSILQEI